MEAMAVTVAMITITVMDLDTTTVDGAITVKEATEEEVMANSRAVMGRLDVEVALALEVAAMGIIHTLVNKTTCSDEHHVNHGCPISSIVSYLTKSSTKKN